MIQKNKKIQVTFVINDFIVGGAQRQLARQLHYYDGERFTISIITLFQFKEKATLYHLLPSNVPLYKLPFRGFLDIRQWFRMINILRETKPDIVVSSLFFSNTVCRLLKPFLRFRSIAREHNTYTYKKWWAKTVDRVLARMSYKIVAVSSEVAEFTAAQERIPTEKFVVIQNGIDLQEVREKVKVCGPTVKEEVYAQLHLSLDMKLVVSVGRMTPQKNQKNLIDAFAEFYQAHPEYALCILGGGGLLDELLAHVKTLGVEDRVFLLGSVSDVERYYLASEFFVSASLIEGLSNAHLEALAFGLPIVVTQTGGTRELLRDGKNGLLIRGSSKEDIRTALESMVGADRTTMRAEAFRAAQAFDMVKTVERYEALFTECMNQSI